MTQPPGWYPNPGGQGERWWDGEQWASHPRPSAPVGKGIKHPRSGPTLVQYVIFSMIAVGTLISLIYEFHGTGKPSRDHQVIVRVTGPGPALSISEGTPDGLEQHNDRALPYQDLLVVHTGAVVTIGSQTSGSGKITCEILLDGAVVKSVTSEGAFATCTTAYAVP